MKPYIGRNSLAALEAAVGELFEKLRLQVLGNKHPGGKKLFISYKPELTLTGIFNAGSQQEGVKPRQEVLDPLLRVASSYLDAAESRAKAKVVQAVQATLQQAQQEGVKTDLETVLGGKIYEVLGETKRDVQKILETESTVVRNFSIVDGITRISALGGEDDPSVFFVVVRDGQRCSECTRLHLLDDLVTPRVWRLSEVGTGYHKKGDPNPKIGGLHPHCRCVLTSLMPGYGFDAGGKVIYRGPDWNELEHQRGTEK